jgi:hypothetical protein
MEKNIHVFSSDISNWNKTIRVLSSSLSKWKKKHSLKPEDNMWMFFLSSSFRLRTTHGCFVSIYLSLKTTHGCFFPI